MNYLPLFAEMGALYRGALTFLLVCLVVGLVFSEIGYWISNHRTRAEEMKLKAEFAGGEKERWKAFCKEKGVSNE